MASILRLLSDHLPLPDNRGPPPKEYYTLLFKSKFDFICSNASDPGRTPMASLGSRRLRSPASFSRTRSASTTEMKFMLRKWNNPCPVYVCVITCSANWKLFFLPASFPGLRNGASWASAASALTWSTAAAAAAVVVVVVAAASSWPVQPSWQRRCRGTGARGYSPVQKKSIFFVFPYKK